MKRLLSSIVASVIVWGGTAIAQDVPSVVVPDTTLPTGERSLYTPINPAMIELAFYDAA